VAVRTALTAVLFVFAVFPLSAQDQEATARQAAGCGPDKVQFSVKTDKKERPAAQPPAGKALVYMFETERVEPNAVDGLRPTIRIGLDGAWAGAAQGDSYFSFAVDPGAHAICASWQSSLQYYAKLAAATNLKAEAGKTYCLETEVELRQHRTPDVRLERIEPAEAALLMGDHAFATSNPKK
jgi:hypothetical protein